MARIDIHHGGWGGIERGREYESRVLRSGMCRVRRREGGELTIVMIFHVNVCADELLLCRSRPEPSECGCEHRAEGYFG